VLTPQTELHTPTDDLKLPADILALLADLPRYANRKDLAELHRKFYAPISPRSLEVWPLEWRVINGHAVSNVRHFMIVAQSRFDAAPVIRGGRRATQKASP
jgi:hypothetical protein